MVGRVTNKYEQSPIATVVKYSALSFPLPDAILIEVCLEAVERRPKDERGIAAVELAHPVARLGSAR